MRSQLDSPLGKIKVAGVGLRSPRRPLFGRPPRTRPPARAGGHHRSSTLSDTPTDTFLRKPWGSSVRIEDDLWRLRLKNPVGSLLVNTFVHRHRDTLAVIDPGWPWDLQLLEDALHDLGFGGIAEV